MFIVEENATWIALIRVKHEVDEGAWFTQQRRGSCVVGLRKATNKEFDPLK